MTLSQYLADQKMPDEAFAAELGTTRATVSRWRRGLVRPRWAALEMIRQATNGLVTADDFLGGVGC
jgi:DNA-binding transcriptional regulator YiaG